MLFKNLTKMMIVSVCLLLSGCLKKGSLKGQKEIILIPKNNINQGFCLKVYLVQIYSEEALTEINGMETEQFFEKIRQLVLVYPEEIKVWEYDIIENSAPICFVIPGRKKYWGLSMFFKFIENVENKFSYPTNLKSVELTVEDNKFEITNINKKFKYTKDKNRTPMCVYLNHSDCILQPSNKKKKTKK